MLYTRSHVTGTASPVKSRERVLHSEPPAELDLLEEFPDTRRVGVVKPYAIVELNKSWMTASQENLTNHSLTLPSNFKRDTFSPPSIPRPRVSSFTAVALRSTTMSPTPYPHSSSTTPRSMSSPSRHGRIIPKRKAPPPPDTYKRKGNNMRAKRSSSVPPQGTTDLMLDELAMEPSDPVTCKTKTVSVNKASVIELRPKENSPPRKPPRTQSTFFTDLPPSSSQMSLVYPFEAKTDMHTNTGRLKQSFKPPASDYEPLRKPGISMSSMSLLNPSPTVIEQLHEIFSESLSNISSRCLKELSSTEELWNIDWSDITVCTDEQENHQLFYHKHPISVEVNMKILIQL